MDGTESNSHLSTLAQRNLQLLESGEYHDFVIKCGEREFKVHRNIVCPQSSFFRSVCRPTWKEGSEGVVNLEEQDPTIVELALKFIYTGSYDAGCATQASLEQQYSGLKDLCNGAGSDVSDQFLTQVRVYILADFLDVPELRQVSFARCEHFLFHHFDEKTLLEPISLAMTNTKHTDVALRGLILKTCVEFDTEPGSDLALLLQNNEPLAWSLLQDKQAQIRNLTGSAFTSHAGKMQLERDLENRKKEIARAHDNIRSTVKLLNTHHRCRTEGCDKEFGASLETFANGYVKALQCKRCRRRHTQPD